MNARSALLGSLLAVLAPTMVACSNAASEEEVDEGALENVTSEFAFDPNSSAERAGAIDDRNAYWAAKLSVVSYEHETEASLQTALRELRVPFEEAIVFHASETDAKNPLGQFTGTSGIYVRTRTAGFLVFRGSEDGKHNDVITDATVVQIPARIGLNEATEGRVHLGFHTALHSVWEPLREKMKRRHGDGQLPLYVMGHSLGGAVGTLAMHQLLFDECLNSKLARLDVLSRCKKEYVPVKALYTFGSPRTGNEEFMTMLANRTRETGTKVFRFVNEGDQVSMLPRAIPRAIVEPFRHFGLLGDEKTFAILIKKDGSLVANPREGCAENPNLVQCDLSLWDGLGGIAGGTPPWKTQHSRKIYLEKMRAKVTRTPLKEELVRDSE